MPKPLSRTSSATGTAARKPLRSKPSSGRSKAVQSRVSRDLALLVSDYRRVIASYLDNRDKTGLLLGLRKKAAQRRATAVALMQLDALDSQRLAWRSAQRPASPSSQTQAAPR